MYIEHTPNHAQGRGKYKPEAIVVHITEGNLKSSLDWIKSPKSQVSYHYLISRLNDVYELVETQNTAWHSGKVVKPTWKLLKAGVNPNLYTIGLALEVEKGAGPTFGQICILAGIIQDIAKEFHIPIDRLHIIGHNEIRSDKTCPSPQVNLDALIYLAKLELSN